MPLALTIRRECWPVAGSFSLSRGTKTVAEVVVAQLDDGEYQGWGECVPYARYGETVPGVIAALNGMRPFLVEGAQRAQLATLLAPGAARNALDCAFWDLAAKRAGRPVHELAGLAPPRPVVTAYTISFDSPDAMAAAAASAAWRPVLKVKLGATGSLERLRAIRSAAPAAELLVDANEAWRAENLEQNLAACAETGVTLVEQPLPAGADAALATIRRPIRLCADESVHDRASLAGLAGLYDVINIKLDKAGGLTEAIDLLAEAARQSLSVMVGSMVATSLGIAPALLLAQAAQFVDLDGPLLLAHDRPGGLIYDGSLLHPASPSFWG